MPEFRIPEDVARFVLEQIDSVAELEALLLLRNDRDKDWNAPALSARLYIGEEETAHVLALLRDRGFVRQSGDEPVVFRYDPVSQELGDKLERLAGIYAKHLVPWPLHFDRAVLYDPAAPRLQPQRLQAASLGRTLLSRADLEQRFTRDRQNYLPTEANLITWRFLSALLAMLVLLYGIIFDAE